MRCNAKHANKCALLLTDGGVASVTSSPAWKKALTGERASQPQQEDRILADEDPMKTVPSSAPAGMY